MRSAPLRCYATDPDTRPDCKLTPVVAFGATQLCASCAARRSTMGKGQRPRPRSTSPGNARPRRPYLARRG
jgi:hypothetical protein